MVRDDGSRSLTAFISVIEWPRIPAVYLKDLGNIKILDFKKPNSTEYRIRFLFEEDYCRLHISGDLGELIAMNYRNMCWNQFDDFVNDIDYFQEKILCHSRPFFVYDQEQAEEDITKYMDRIILMVLKV